MHTYKDLVVWQKSVEFAEAIYRLTDKFPTEERFGLTSQMRRAAVSIASNIAEGKLRGSSREFKQFLLIAFVSGGELETQLEISKRLNLHKSIDYTGVESLLSEIMRMLNAMISRVSAPSA